MKILEPELVPIQFWRRRSHPLTSSGWGEVRKQELARTGNKCEYCGTKYDKGLIIHHEYEFKVEQRDKINSDGSIDTTIQRYVSGYAVSCKYCNLVLHWQFASGIGRSNFAVQHLMKIRNMTEEQARNLILEKVNLWVERCKMTAVFGDADRYLFRSDNIYVDTQTGLELR